ncbi:hypothetical protein WAG12_06235 [Bacillus cereus]|uniref:hypothetical protein n=1 Tax=Bacillus cereus group TaxID=86661 RepID=UPI002DBFE7B4|nr:hypothetical protein [Bacillus tropicus]MEC1979326.1 hypothetical protein [Bacillus cereus]MEC2922195.1 hypothetical protein [Bacillus tropicus]MEC2925071.1 hypothetical protein [Bacillus tropicus]MEC2957512.1 hypothetical protein [Bacillus tropicus]MEC3048416.1 hypothetical protein [Bacillus tropicus]
MRQNFNYYFVIYPIVFFIVFTLSPILFSKKEYMSIQDTLSILALYYFFISVYRSIDIFLENKKSKKK